jgi:hypothetical protein
MSNLTIEVLAELSKANKNQPIDQESSKKSSEKL